MMRNMVRTHVDWITEDLKICRVFCIWTTLRSAERRTFNHANLLMGPNLVTRPQWPSGQIKNQNAVINIGVREAASLRVARSWLWGSQAAVKKNLLLYFDHQICRISINICSYISIKLKIILKILLKNV